MKFNKETNQIEEITAMDIHALVEYVTTKFDENQFTAHGYIDTINQKVMAVHRMCKGVHKVVLNDITEAILRDGLYNVLDTENILDTMDYRLPVFVFTSRNMIKEGITQLDIGSDNRGEAYGIELFDKGFIITDASTKNRNLKVYYKFDTEESLMYITTFFIMMDHILEIRKYIEEKGPALDKENIERLNDVAEQALCLNKEAEKYFDNLLFKIKEEYDNFDINMGFVEQDTLDLNDYKNAFLKCKYEIKL